MKERADIHKSIFFGIAGITAILVFVIIGFLIYAAAPVLETSGIGFITNSVWNYDTNQYGIFIFLIDTIIVTALTLALAIPFGLLTAMYLAEWAPAWMEKIIRPIVELLVGIPSVVYGLFGVLILSTVFMDFLNPTVDHLLGFIPIFRNIHPNFHQGLFLSAAILAIMVIPTIVALSQEAMRGVSSEYREASIALGATQWETMRNVILPCAFPGIVTAVVLAMMRAMGETMAIVMLLGNTPIIPSSIFDVGYTMTAKILNDILYYVASPQPRAAIFGIAVVLFFMEMLAVAGVRLICSWAQRRS
ncbi:phosphate ABC transporter, inner membrane subunit PstC [Methanoregula boonei 6A8]|jgi:phosphate transport system permease protein|uniref:Phosphate transport system permease protein n=1 Tax=Methanoregula boonei (strain DSM 21154 / JCM 14090 / 6A8) TaxID=456442 RepID=A7IB20_METB6|nr:phosphate ABC transporter permease subunit PstC [Methanoregula boonei]ABS56931.1 phosphate ABC transporter, inner membrane subunit PstC [Methanoregula boonei 6A8]